LCNPDRLEDVVVIYPTRRIGCDTVKARFAEAEVDNGH
jgi:hypothetical protein